MSVSTIAAHHTNVIHQKRKIMLVLWVKFLYVAYSGPIIEGAFQTAVSVRPRGSGGPELGGARTRRLLSAWLLGPRLRGEEWIAWGPDSGKTKPRMLVISMPGPPLRPRGGLRKAVP